MYSLGINVGSTSVKVVLCEDGDVTWNRVLPHDGNVQDTLLGLVNGRHKLDGTPAMVTGNEGRTLVNLPGVIESLCVERAVKKMGVQVRAVVSMGGEDLVVYLLDDEGTVTTSVSGNKCAAGTGEFFKQQLGRMDMTLADVAGIPEDSRVMKLSMRCSVFMKSDCTHRLNKGEATTGDIVMSLSSVMATKVQEFLQRAGISEGRVLLAGGLTRNAHMVKMLCERMPEVDFVVPDSASYLEAWGAALLAADSGVALPSTKGLFNGGHTKFATFRALEEARELVKVAPSQRGRPVAGRHYILGVDGGSTTTKACLIDVKTREIAAAHYGRTHGDPVRALKKCIVELKKQLQEAIGDEEIFIDLAATTGSSREILGVFLQTPAVYNEIIAHSVGTTFFEPGIDTIFEIGGQDAKYVYLKNRVPIDYAMNEACSAGTGSFLEESAAGDLNIERAEEIGPVALGAKNPLKFGEHCSAFINSDIRKAVQLGASREDIAAGLVTSIVANYLNRVVCNRTIGNHIVLQGGVARNEAVPLAFAQLLGKPIMVPPDPELMGCFGVALLAMQKLKDGFLENKPLELDGILASEIVYEREFKCKACDNQCPVRVLRVGENRYMFGGRCDKYANMRKARRFDESEVVNYVDLANDLLFNQCTPDPETIVVRRDYTVGVPRCFTVHALWPFYSWFFHTLGIRARLTDKVAQRGVARVETGYCFPGEIAHGAVQDALDKGFDYIFLPHTRDMESFENDVHACFCPITQSLPYYIEQAFPEIPRHRLLTPVVSFKYGKANALKHFVALGRKLGFCAAEVEKAYDAAAAGQEEYVRRCRELGSEALEQARRKTQPVIALFGRPYNAFTSDANMGIPRKFVSRGHTIIPFDILPFEGHEDFPNMYWFHGQQNMKAAAMLKEESNIFVTYISNFSCAPDSFMLHYLKWVMGTKPFLILELDSHTADAGVDTRIEAFLDIIEGYRSKLEGPDGLRYDHGWRFINQPANGSVNGERHISLHNIETDERLEIRNNPRVTMLLSNMGRLSAELMAAAVRSSGIDAIAMPVPDEKTLRMARSCVSGKECLPSHLVLGSALQFLESEGYRRDKLYLLLVPETTGPCRTGQYAVFYENLFRDLRVENMVVLKIGSDNSYRELGPRFTRHAWWGLTISDYMKDVETTLRACAQDPVSAMERYDELWQELVGIAETNVAQTIPALERIGANLAKIPLMRRPETCPKVLVVGEIYVRRDDFAVDELVRRFSEKGIIAKVSGITEWLYYCDFTREFELKKRLKLAPWYRRLVTPEMGELVGWNVEQVYKQVVEHRIKKALLPSGLVPSSPHNMRQIMRIAEENFVSHELESEISISSGVAAAAMSEGYSGIVNISPFACLIGRVIEGLLTPWTRRRGYPLISVEIDGNMLPPGTLSKLEIFMLNVLRYNRSPELAELVDQTGNGSVNRLLR